ncbi:MAG: LPS assembly protein LptD [Pseudomonadota bacterium]
MERDTNRSGAPSSGPFHSRFRIASNLLAVLALFVMIPLNTSAFSPPGLAAEDPNEPWHISADKIDYDQKTSTYTGTGNVIISKTGKRLTADFVQFDDKTMKASAVGHVMMTAGEDLLMGSRIDIDLKAETGTVYDGSLFFKKNHFYIKGDTLQKTGEHTYTADRASITTCDGDTPAWKITGKNLKVTIEGYGTVQHAALWAKKVPVMYSPYLIFPAKSKRQSGLLPPQVGYSDNKGAQFFQPLYWAINESSDATLYWNHMELRGEMIGAEYRYVLDTRSKGTLMVDFLDDRKVDDGSPDSGDYGYEGDNVLRPNSDRYWFRAKADQAMPWGVTAKLDLDIVSDQDYLYEFNSGYTGFNRTAENFLDDFGRELDTYDNAVRLNKLNFNRLWDRFSLNAEARYLDNVIARRQGVADPTIQRLPSVTFDASKQQISRTPLFFELDSGYNYFYIEDGDRANRLDAYPRFYLPYRFKNYFAVEPSFSVRETVWRYDQNQYGYSNKDTLSREMVNTRLDLYSEISRVFTVNGKQIEKIRHAAKAQVVYDYIPFKDQHKYPYFDAVDRINSANLLTYSLTNTFTSKSKIFAAEKEGARAEKTTGLPAYDYREVCRFRLEQSYDINKEKDDDPEPFSPIFARLDLVPGGLVSLGADAGWSPYESRFVSHNIAADISDRRGDRLYLEHRYTRKDAVSPIYGDWPYLEHLHTQDAIESIYGDLLLKLTDSVSAYTEYERNLKDDRNIMSGVAMVYTAQCWAIEIGYAYEGGKQFGFMIHLFGFGEFGQPSIIQRRIQYASKRI